jgi:hypothetical protein
LAIRRFKCCDCGRTFSWRPGFLAFGHRFTAAAYEQFLQAQSRSGDWWEPGTAATQAVRDRLRRAAPELTERLERHLKRPLSGRTDAGHVIDLARHIASQQQLTLEESRYSCHVLFLAIASTRAHASYSLTAA